MPTRLIRLTTLLTQLQAGRLITARSLADHHGVSLRTIYRDVRALEAAGVPVINVEGKGYSLLEGYRMPPVQFTEAEAGALITAEILLARNKDASLARAYRSAVMKVKAVLPGSAKDRSDLLRDRMQSRDNPGGDSTSNFLMQLQGALTHYTVCHLAYANVNGYPTERDVEPFAIYTSSGNWILLAYCRRSQDFRAFRLDRIQRLRLLSEHFTPHDLTLEDYLAECRKKYIPTLDTGLSPAPEIFGATSNQTAMQSTKAPSFQVIGISVRTSNADPAQTSADIGGLWQRWLGEQLAGRVPNKTGHTLYCVYTDYESDHTGAYTVVLGCAVSSLADIPEGMHGIEVPGGDFKRFTSKGNLQQGVVYHTWHDIWQRGLDRAYRADYEVYGEKALNPEAAEVEIFVGVR